MKNRSGDVADGADKLVLRCNQGARFQLLGVIPTKTLGRHELARVLDAFDGDGSIGFGREVVRLNFRSIAWVGAADMAVAPAFRSQVADGNDEDWKLMQWLAEGFKRQRLNMIFDVRALVV